MERHRKEPLSLLTYNPLNFDNHHPQTKLSAYIPDIYIYRGLDSEYRKYIKQEYCVVITQPELGMRKTLKKEHKKRASEQYAQPEYNGSLLRRVLINNVDTQ